VRLIEGFEPGIDGYSKASQRMHRSWVNGNDLMVVPRDVQLRTRQAEYLQGDAKLEYAQAFINEDRHGSGMSVHLAKFHRLLSCAAL
jgi:hypothetical protein